MNPIAIIGGGGWGTALAITMARKPREVRLWAYEPYLVETMIATRENPLYLPQAKFYDRSCALGPAITMADAMPPLAEITIQLRIERSQHGKSSDPLTWAACLVMLKSLGTRCASSVFYGKLEASIQVPAQDDRPLRRDRAMRADVLGLDGKLAPAAIDEHCELDRRWTAVIE